MMRFEGKSVLVTGGATGIGRVTAQAFAREGAAVLIGDIDARAEETVALIEQDGGEAAFVRADVTDAAAMDALVAECVGRFGGMDMAFNNAGVLPPQRPLHEILPEEFDLAVNVDGRLPGLRQKLDQQAGVGIELVHGLVEHPANLRDEGIMPDELRQLRLEGVAVFFL